MHARTYSPRNRNAILAWLMMSAASTAATLTIQGTAPDSLNLHLDADPLSYFYLKQSTNLEHFTPFSMVLGNQATVWPLSSEDVPTRFFSVTKISLFAPEDTDGDGIDDVYELRHPILNPLDASDAALLSGNGILTFLQKYRSVSGFDDNPAEVISKELTAFNFGYAIDSAISREVDVYNFGRPFESAISRELVVFNLGSPLFAVEAISPELSVFNGGGGPPTEIGEVYSRELSTFNFGSSISPIDVASMEVSVFNGESIPSSGISEVYSQELSAFNFNTPSSATEVISRELSVINNAL